MLTRRSQNHAAFTSLSDVDDEQDLESVPVRPAISSSSPSPHFHNPTRPAVLITTPLPTYRLSEPIHQDGYTFWIVSEPSNSSQFKSSSKGTKYNRTLTYASSSTHPARTFGFFTDTQRVRVKRKHAVDWEAFMDELDKEHDRQTSPTKSKGIYRDVRKVTKPTKSRKRADSVVSCGQGGSEASNEDRLVSPSRWNAMPVEERIEVKMRPERVLKRCSFWKVPGIPPKRAPHMM